MGVSLRQNTDRLFDAPVSARRQTELPGGRARPWPIRDTWGQSRSALSEDPSHRGAVTTPETSVCGRLSRSLATVCRGCSHRSLGGQHKGQRGAEGPGREAGHWLPPLTAGVPRSPPPGSLPRHPYSLHGHFLPATVSETATSAQPGATGACFSCWIQGLLTHSGGRVQVRCGHMSISAPLQRSSTTTRDGARGTSGGAGTPMLVHF